jgi:DNA-binding NarL/FixJ family response regulator
MTQSEELKPGSRHPVRLIVVDPNEFVRSGTVALFSVGREFEIVGEAANAREALELCRRARPRLVLMDVRMPEMDGIEATREIKRRFSDIDVLILTIYDDRDLLQQAILAGAAGYVLKDAPLHRTIAAVREVAEG